MKQFTRLFRSRRFRVLIFLPLIFAGFVAVSIDTARACWNIVLIECFDHIPQTAWPWDPAPPGGPVWRQFPGNPQPHWYPRSVGYYDVLICPDDDHSLWCYGYPIGNHPDFDVYPSNYNTYVTFGPINLSNQISAQVNWQMWHSSEQLYDSIFWGAATAFTLTDANMKIGGSLWGEDIANEWLPYSMNLNDLRDFLTGDSVSMIGQTAVYVFWRFRSNSNAFRGIGTFLDNIVIAVDDGLQNLTATNLTLVDSDSMTFGNDPVVGDTVLVHASWNVCDGAVELYDPYHVIIAQNGVTLLDTLLEDSHAGQYHNLWTTPWVVTEPGDFVIRMKVDSLEQITENNENDNDSTLAYTVPVPNEPPEFYWVTPESDTLFADVSALMRWFCSDTVEAATVSIYYDNEPQGCVGSLIPGAINRPDIGLDSVAWDTQSQPDLRTYYLFARVADSEHDTCIYAPWPLFVCHTCLSAHERPVGTIPDVYFLNQNYPNPFNPATDIRYGIAVPGNVTLNVFDILGREVASLVNGYREPGSYAVSFDGTSLSSGLYMYVLTSPEGSIGRKMMLMK